MEISLDGWVWTWSECFLRDIKEARDMELMKAVLSIKKGFKTLFERKKGNHFQPRTQALSS